MMVIAAFRPERMNSPLETREVHRRGRVRRAESVCTTIPPAYVVILRSRRAVSPRARFPGGDEGSCPHDEGPGSMHGGRPLGLREAGDTPRAHPPRPSSPPGAGRRPAG
jgi:hypothetical protein